MTGTLRPSIILALALSGILPDCLAPAPLPPRPPPLAVGPAPEVGAAAAEREPPAPQGAAAPPSSPGGVAPAPGPLSLHGALRRALAANPELVALRRGEGVAEASLAVVRTCPYNPKLGEEVRIGSTVQGPRPVQALEGRLGAVCEPWGEHRTKSSSVRESQEVDRGEELVIAPEGRVELRLRARALALGWTRTRRSRGSSSDRGGQVSAKRAVP